MEKPKNTSGNYCPLRGKPCLKVCHTCELWVGLPAIKDKVPVVEWNCSLVWAGVSGPILSKRLDGIQAATEGMRNQFHELRHSLAQLIGALASRMWQSPHSGGAPSPTLPPYRLTYETVRDPGTAADPPLIENGTGDGKIDSTN